METTLQPGRLYRLVIGGWGTSKYHPVFFGSDYEIAPAPDFDPFYCYAASCSDAPTPRPHGLLEVNGAYIQGSLRVGEPIYYPPYNDSHVYEFFVFLKPAGFSNTQCKLGGGGDASTFTPNDALYINGTSSWFSPCDLVTGPDGQLRSERGRLRISVSGDLGRREPDPFVRVHSGSFEITISDVGPAPAAPGVAPSTPPAAKPRAVWSGTWRTSFGQMLLKQTGNRVTGTYTHDRGRIEGKLIGEVLKGKWNEAPTRRGPRDAGDFQFKFTADRSAFTSRWRYEGSSAWRTNWTGTCIKGPCKNSRRGG